MWIPAILLSWCEVGPSEWVISGVAQQSQRSHSTSVHHLNYQCCQRSVSMYRTSSMMKSECTGKSD